MIKKIFSMLLLVCLFAPISAGAINQYDYQVWDKSPGTVLEAGGDGVILWVKLKNTGSNKWVNEMTYDGLGCYIEGDPDGCVAINPIHLGTVAPTDRMSNFYAMNNWISENRLHKGDQGMVRPGEVMDFGFYVEAPFGTTPGRYKECFAPVIENESWIQGETICWDINVINNPNAYDAKVGYYDPMLKMSGIYLEKNQEKEVSVSIQNTGNTTWYKYGSAPVHLAVWQDKKGNLYHPDWLADNRPASMNEEVVRMGEYATFTFKIRGNGSPKEEYDNYWVVAENKSWMSGFNGNEYLGSVTIKRTKVVPINFSNSTMTVDKNRIKADGIDQGLITVELRDAENNVLPDRKFELGVYPDYICKNWEETFLTTDKNGQATSHMYCSQPGDFSYFVSVNQLSEEENGYQKGVDVTFY